MVSFIKVIAFAASISAHVLTLGSAKDQALFDNYLSPMQVSTGTVHYGLYGPKLRHNENFIPRYFSMDHLMLQ